MGAVKRSVVEFFKVIIPDSKGLRNKDEGGGFNEKGVFFGRLFDIHWSGQ